MDGRGPPKEGRVFLKSHGNCFLHATAPWLKYWRDTLVEVGGHLPTNTEINYPLVGSKILTHVCV